MFCCRMRSLTKNVKKNRIKSLNKKVQCYNCKLVEHYTRNSPNRGNNKNNSAKKNEERKLVYINVYIRVLAEDGSLPSTTIFRKRNQQDTYVYKYLLTISLFLFSN